jgi:hypothetical protein
MNLQRDYTDREMRRRTTNWVTTLGVSNDALAFKGRPLLTVTLPWVIAFQEPKSHWTSLGSPMHEMAMLTPHRNEWALYACAWRATYWVAYSSDNS